jgi:hypothetical protein
MSTIKVYQFRMYDASNDEMRKSRRYATRERIDWLRGEVIEGTGVEIDATLLGSEVEGMTARDFDPHRQTDFQRQVTR